MAEETDKEQVAFKKELKELREDVRKLYAMQARHGNQLNMLARAFVKKKQADEGVITRPKLVIGH